LPLRERPPRVRQGPPRKPLPWGMLTFTQIAVYPVMELGSFYVTDVGDQGMKDHPWWHPTQDDDWNEPLPAIVVLSPDYMAKLPLWGDSGTLPWQRSKLSPELLDRLVSWQEEFDSNFDFDAGWSSNEARNRWAAEARDLAGDVLAQLASRAKLMVDLWPLRDTVKE